MQTKYTTPIGHEYTDEIVCPYCGHEHSDSIEFFENGNPDYSIEIECCNENCNEVFSVVGIFSISYTSWKLED